jgi:hypothetical protein
MFLFFIGYYSYSIAQENNNEHRGTIKVEKKDLLTLIQYDNVNYRLIGIDQYGNVLDSAVREFEMQTTIKGIAYSEKATGSYLTYQMQKIIGRCDGSCKLLFTNILAKDKKGNMVKMKPYTYTFGRKVEQGEQ